MTFLWLIILMPLQAHADQEVHHIKMTFDELPQLVKERNDHYKAAQSQVEASEIRTGYLLRSFLPTLEGGAGIEKFKTGPLSPRTQPYSDLTTQINLFRGGRDVIENRVIEQRLVFSKNEALSVQATELMKVRKLFWTLVYQREVKNLLNEISAKNSENLNSAKKRISAGLGSETDRMEFEIRQTSLEQDLARIELELRNTQRNLNAYLGNDERTGIDTETVIPHDHQDSILSEVLNTETHREIQSLRSQQEIALLSSKNAARWWTPSIHIYGSYGLFTERERGYGDSKYRQDVSVGAKATFNLFDGGTSLNESRALSRESQALELKSTQNRRELIADFENAKSELALMHQLIHGYEKNTEQARSYLKSTLSEYSRGLKNSPDVLGANQKYAETLLRYAEARKDYQMARTEMLGILGK